MTPLATGLELGTGDRAWFRFRYRIALVVPVPDCTGCSSTGSGANFSSGRVPIQIHVQYIYDMHTPIHS